MKNFNIEDLVLADITLSDASVENPEDIVLSEQEQSLLEFNFSSETLFNLEIEGVLIKLFIEVKSLNEKEEFTSIKANYTTQFLFKVKGLAEYIKEEDNQYSIEPHLNISMLNIVYSTSRGIIYTRSLGTAIGTVILPVISSQALLDISRQSKSERSTASK